MRGIIVVTSSIAGIPTSPLVLLFQYHVMQDWGETRKSCVAVSMVANERYIAVHSECLLLMACGITSSVVSRDLQNPHLIFAPRFTLPCLHLLLPPSLTIEDSVQPWAVRSSEMLSICGLLSRAAIYCLEASR